MRARRALAGGARRAPRARMTALAVSLSASLWLASPAQPPLSAEARSSTPRTDADALRAAERDALRALAVLAAGAPPIAEVQEAAARAADRSVPEARGLARRARLAALLPTLTTEYRHEERSYRVVGLQGSGEVDYTRLAPGRAFVVRATWDLGELVAARGELPAAVAESERARRRGEAVRRATALYQALRRARLALLLAPPADALARAEAELEVDGLAAELDALTGGLLSGRRP
jgi:hypothetical protein